MKDSIKKLYDFIQDHPGKKEITPEEIEGYLLRMKAYTLQDDSDWNLYVLSLSMLSSLANSGFCSVNEPIGPFLDFVQECAREYLEESEGEEIEPEKQEGIDLQLFSEDEIDHLFSEFPDKRYLPNNVFSSEMAKGLINSGKQTLTFDRKRDVSTELEVTRPANSGSLTIYGNYDYFDIAVSNAMDDIFLQESDHSFTLQHLYRVINHDPDAKASENEKQAMIESIEAQRVTKAEGDLKPLIEEASRRGIDVSNVPQDLNDMIISVMGGHKEAGGEIVPVYIIKNRPFPSLLGELTGQELKIPAKCYNVRKVDSKEHLGATLSKNRARIAMTEYIVDRVFSIKNDNSLAKEKKRKYDASRRKNPKKPERALVSFRDLKSNIIKYDSIFEAASLTDVPRNTLTRHKKYIKQCFQYLRAIHEIKGFREICGKRKNSVDRVEILID